jgi:hypothetical protein
VRVELDETRDEARIYVSDERQSHERAATHLVLANDKNDPHPSPTEVQLGFKDYRRLLFVTVRPASEALPAEVLASATRRRLG